MSSIEIGSSATSSSGPSAIARAMTARCFWPPDSSVGYFAVNRAAGARPTRSSAASTACGAIAAGAVRGCAARRRSPGRRSSTGSARRAGPGRPSAACAAAGAVGDSTAGQLLVAVGDASAGRPDQPEQRSAEGRLAGAGLTDQAEHLTLARGRRRRRRRPAPCRTMPPTRRDTALVRSAKCTCRSRTRSAVRLGRVVAGSGASSGFVGNGHLLAVAAAAGSRPSAVVSSQHSALGPTRPTCGGWSVAQTCIACGQRGWNRQPGGGSHQVGRRARDGVQLLGRTARSSSCSSACVYGCCGSANISRTGPCSTISPGVHHGDPVARLGDDPEVVRDQQDRGGGTARGCRRGCAGSAPRPARRARWSARPRR